MKEKNITYIKEKNKEEETLKLLKQAQVLYNIKGNIPVSYSDIIIHFNLLMSELSLKSLCIFYLNKYEKTHYFGDENILNALKQKISFDKDIKKAIITYKNLAKNYYLDSRYNQTNLNYSSKQANKIDKISEMIFLLAWRNFQDLITKYPLEFPSSSSFQLQ